MFGAVLATSLVFGFEPRATRVQRSPPFDGIQVNLGNLFRTSAALTRSISAENPTGKKGRAAMAVERTGQHAARELGRAWKVSPFAMARPNTTITLAEISGPGAIQQM
jgi:hypothetical protein